MGKLSPRIPREHNKYHGYTVRGTPHCPLRMAEWQLFGSLEIHPEGGTKGQCVTYLYTGIPTTIKTMDVNITTIVYLRVLIIQIGSTIVLMVVEA